MGFLNKFFKKKQEKQLEELEKKPDVKVEEKRVQIKKPKKIKKVEKKIEEVEKKVAESKATKSKPKTAKKSKSGQAHRVLIAPLVSEKAATVEAMGKYTFVVAKDASKMNIKQAIQDIYGIVPEKISVMNMEGKQVRFGRYFGKRKDWKKAIVSLPKGRTINIHEGV